VTTSSPLNEDRPSVSVVIPTYNCARYLPEAVDSVLAQTYRDFETIVVDDGSTDNTPEVLAPYGDQIRVIRQANAGRSAARNAGVLAAQGEYIAFLDADDLWLPQKLEKQIALLDARPEVGWVYSDFRRFSEEGPERACNFAEAGIDEPPEGIVLISLMSSFLTCTDTIVVRAECLRRVGPFDVSLPVQQDQDMWIRLACECQAGCVPEVLALYRQHSEQVTRQASQMLYAYCGWRVYSKLLRAERRQLGPRLPGDAARVAHRRLASYACAIARLAAAAGDRWTARRWLVRATPAALLGDRDLLLWCLGRLLDTMLPARAMEVARRVKRAISQGVATARAVHETQRSANPRVRKST